MEHMAGLLILCGISTFVMGALTGSFLGDFLPRLAKLIRPDTTFTALPRALYSPYGYAGYPDWFSGLGAAAGTDRYGHQCCAEGTSGHLD